MSKKINDLLAKIKDSETSLKSLAVDIFSEIDPEKKHYRELVWLAAMPETLRPQAFTIFSQVIDGVIPKELPLSELVRLTRSSIMFEVLESGEIYETSGRLTNDDKIAVKILGSEFLSFLHGETLVRRFF